MELWHKRLGHVSSTVLSRMFSVNKQSACRISKCLVCPYAKQTRNVFPKSSIKSTACFELLHVDLWGPYNTTTIDGKKYFLTIVDDFSRVTWLFLLSHKSAVCSFIQTFLKFVQAQFGKRVKVLRTDNGTEFVNSGCHKLFAELGILHQRSCPYTSQQNGVAERKHRHSLEVTRALRLQAHSPIRYCGHCLLAAAHIINRLPSSVLKFDTPYERLYGSKPSVSHVKTLGCLCFAKLLTEHDKLMPRSRPAVLMGYSELQKGYILLDLTDKSFFTSRDVVFREDLFPFAKMDHLIQEKVFVNPMQVSDMLSDDLQCTSSKVSRCSPTNVSHETPTMSSFNEVDHSESPTVDNEVSQETATLTNVRRSVRQKLKPTWMKDFVSLTVNKDVIYSLGNYMRYAHLSPTYQSYIAANSVVKEPDSYLEAIQDERWIEAMQNEIQALESNHTWELTYLPKGKKAIGGRWIYKVKYNSSGEIERFKARLVAKGYSQQEGIDYKETFSPSTSLCLFK